MALVVAGAAAGALWLLLWVLGLLGRRWGGSLDEGEQLMSTWRRLVGRFLHPSHYGDIEAERKGVFFVTYSWVCFGVSLVMWVLLSHDVGPRNLGALAMGCNTLFFGVVVTAAKLTSRLTVVASVFGVWINTFVFVTCVIEGQGIASHSFIYYAVQPTFAFFMFGTRIGVGMSSIVFLQGVMLWRIAVVDLFPLESWLADLNMKKPHGLDTINQSCVIFLIAMMSFIYECCRSFTLHQLQQALLEKEVTYRQLCIATDAKTKFMANVSHELRTPLHGIISFSSELLSQSELPEEAREFTQTIADCADHLLSLVSDILDFERIESGSMELEQVPFSIANELNKVKNMLSRIAAQKDLTLDISTRNIKHAVRIGDPGRFRQVLFNLLHNAIKFTPEGGAVWTTIKEGKHNNLRVEVRDTGIGISEQVQRQLFQGDSSISRRYGGSGLGLAISKRLCEAMNGKIGCESVVGKGTKFWFTVSLPMGSPQDAMSDPLPEEQSEAADFHYWRRAEMLSRKQSGSGNLGSLRDHPNKDLVAIQEEKTIPRPCLLPSRLSSSEAIRTRQVSADGGVNNTSLATGGSLDESLLPRKKKVLLVEDNIINQKVAVRMLAPLEVQVTVAENGLECLQLLRKNEFDLILMDCQMPVLDGFEASLRIRELEKIHQAEEEQKNGQCVTTKTRIPIIALTASATLDYQKRCQDCGMDAFMAKPLKKDVLWRTLQHFLPDIRLGGTPLQEAREAECVVKIFAAEH